MWMKVFFCFVLFVCLVFFFKDARMDLFINFLASPYLDFFNGLDHISKEA